MYLIDSFFNQKDSEFIDLINKDLKNFTNNIKLNKVLLLPPIDSYHRYLAHQIVNNLYQTQLNSFSLGEKENRRLFICSKQLKIKYNELKMNNNENDDNNVTTTASSANQVNKQQTDTNNGNNKKSKQQKRPSQTLYVPKGRRLNNTQQDNNSTSDLTKKSDSNVNTSLNESQQEQQGPVLIDPCIVGYIKSPSKQKKPENGATSDSSSNGNGVEYTSTNDAIETTLSALDKLSINGKSSSGSVSPSVTTNLAVPAEDEASSWENLYDDNGECKDKNLLKELNNAIEDKIELDVEHLDSINYLKWIPNEVKIEESEFPHVVEIYDFPTNFKNEDIYSVFKSSLGHDDFDIKWVDDTHCLGVFSNISAAREALNINNGLIKTRQISKATELSKRKAQKCVENLKPYKARPATTCFVASKLITNSLGLGNALSKDKMNEEKQKLQNARDKKRREKQQQDAIWNGDIKKYDETSSNQ